MSTTAHAVAGVDPVGIVLAVVCDVAGLVVTRGPRGAWPWLACRLTAADSLVVFCSAELFDQAPFTEATYGVTDDGDDNPESNAERCCCERCEDDA